MTLLAPQSRSSDLALLLAALPQGWQELMHRRGLISAHPDTRLAQPEDIMRLVLLHVGCDLPLRQTVEWARAAGLPSCSHVSLHAKMRRLPGFMTELVGRMSARRHLTDAASWGGYDVIAVDGSVVVTPGPSSAGGRLHVGLRVSDLAVVDAHVTTTDDGETLRRFEFSKNQLVVADRGYANPPGLQHVVDQGADVLVRVNRSSLPLYAAPSDKPISVLAWVRDLRGQRAHERPVLVRSASGRQLEGRLVAQRVPAAKVEAARQRVRREVGDDSAALLMAEWVVVFTTASSKRLTAAQVMELYRLRWQVELLFKRWKSLCHLDLLPNYRKDTLVTWLSSKLLLILCADELSNAATRGFSPLSGPIPMQGEASQQSAPPTVEVAHDDLAGPPRRAPANIAA